MPALVEGLDARVAGFDARVAGFDARVEEVVERLRGRPGLDRVFYTATAVGDHSLIWLVGAGIRAAISPSYRPAATRLAVTLGLESVLVNGGIKSVFRRQRPALEGEHPHHIRQPLTSSFPSGHASSAACALVLLADGDPVWPVYSVVAALVAASRLYVRIHHGSDVVGGVVVGTLLGLAVRRRFPLSRP